MESVLGERLVGEHPMATQELFRTVHFAILTLYAAWQFRKGIDGLNLDSQDKEQTETTEEANNVGSRYYCHQCAVPLDVNMAYPLFQGCFMEKHGCVSSLHPHMLSESEPSASDTDRNEPMVIPPSNPTVPDIVNNNNGSALNRLLSHSLGSHDYSNYGGTHQAPAHDDSNPSRSFLRTDGSDHAVTSNSVPGHAVPYVSSSNSGSPPRYLVANAGTDQPHHGTRVTSSVWIFSAIGFGFEAVSAFFDQVSTPQKPHYALYGMLLSFVAVLVCILDLILNARKQSTSENNILWNILPEVFGLALACIQFTSSALQFSFLCRHAANPVKVSVVPFLFFFVLFAFKCRNGRN
ncbi:hypothetical protein RchiOBHm_Chr5g0039451 [Rosa chinensis]|uniref:Uncharacterized protein n=1 Tax=Rosa chinensis TaxID=74649 RepID=A0A2P6QCB0_ROSCH|nr:uncharacterized protein LOC112165707 isoform X2 [Rosa chinensis]PRQ31802.1 hypothetical protein RchiOBHm_Chr5g0039451 [Rosa chinensis]